MVSSIPAPPKHGGSGGFIAAAVIMLLLTGGLIFWKFRSKPAPAPPPVASASAPQSPVLEEPPPPPPPPSAVADAGEKVEKPVVHGHWSGGCSGTCKGSASALLRSALRGKAGQARGCYERALRVNPTLKGHLAVNVRIGPEGQVCSASIASNGLGSAGVANCVLQMFRAGKFPAPQGGCVDTQVPMNFIPKP
jgi:hypothetical protein